MVITCSHNCSSTICSHTTWRTEPILVQTFNKEEAWKLVCNHCFHASHGSYAFCFVSGKAGIFVPITGWVADLGPALIHHCFWFVKVQRGCCLSSAWCISSCVKMNLLFYLNRIEHSTVQFTTFLYLYCIDWSYLFCELSFLSHIFKFYFKNKFFTALIGVEISETALHWL